MPRLLSQRTAIRTATSYTAVRYPFVFGTVRHKSFRPRCICLRRPRAPTSVPPDGDTCQRGHHILNTACWTPGDSARSHCALGMCSCHRLLHRHPGLLTRWTSQVCHLLPSKRDGYNVAQARRCTRRPTIATTWHAAPQPCTTGRWLADQAGADLPVCASSGAYLPALCSALHVVTIRSLEAPARPTCNLLRHHLVCLPRVRQRRRRPAARLNGHTATTTRRCWTPADTPDTSGRPACTGCDDGSATGIPTNAAGRQRRQQRRRTLSPELGCVRHRSARVVDALTRPTIMPAPTPTDAQRPQRVLLDASRPPCTWMGHTPTVICPA